MKQFYEIYKDEGKSLVEKIMKEFFMDIIEILDDLEKQSITRYILVVLLLCFMMLLKIQV